MQRKTRENKNKNMNKPKNKLTNQAAITLIALVVTIVVLLILAGVSISMVIGKNGIITQAKSAVNETKRRAAQEKVEVEVLGSYNTKGNIDLNLLNKNLSNIKGIEGLPISKLPDKVIVDGFEITIEGRVDDPDEELEEVELKIGDYVNYYPQNLQTTYTFEKQYTGFSTNQVITQEELKWQILSINENNIDLISTTATQNKISFTGDMGYNNGVYLLNDFCNKLYGNTQKNATARSVNIEDIEDRMNLTVWDYHNSGTSAGQYNMVKTLGNSNIGGPANVPPYIWTLEKSESNAISGVLTNGTLGRSEQKELITTSPSITDYETVTLTQTMWNDWNKELKFTNSEQYNLFFKTNLNYWIASRGTFFQTGGTGAYGLQMVKDKGVCSSALCYATQWVGDSPGYLLSPQTENEAILPIVTISIKNIDKSIGDGKSEKTAWGIK